MFAQIIDNNIAKIAGRVPPAARRLDTREWVLALADAAPDVQRACGLVQVTDTPRPDDTDTTTHDHGVALVDGAPVVAWTPRAWRTDELATRQAEVNRRTIDAAIVQALAELQAIIDAPDVPVVPAGTLTAANLSNGLRTMRESVQQNRDGAKRIARTLRHTIRLARGDYDGID